MFDKQIEKETHLLQDLATQYKASKLPNYYEAYASNFYLIKNESLKILEIGIENGGSLKMWKDYFPNSTIYGLDIEDCRDLEEDRIKIFHGSQNDPELLRSISKKAGGFHIILDDGSHYSNDVIVSFVTLFPLMIMGGIYMVEDLQTSYWGWQDNTIPIKGPVYPMFDPKLINAEPSAMNYFRDLTHHLNYGEIPITNYHPTIFDTHIRFIQFFHNMVFIHKGNNEHISTMKHPYPHGLVNNS